TTAARLVPVRAPARAADPRLPAPPEPQRPRSPADLRRVVGVPARPAAGAVQVRTAHGVGSPVGGDARRRPGVRPLGRRRRHPQPQPDRARASLASQSEGPWESSKVARPLRVLFAGLTLPHPPTNGHRLRTWAMVQALADDGHRVTLVAFAERAELLGDLEPLRTACAEIDLVPTPLGPRGRGRDALKRLRALASPLPFGAWKFRSPSSGKRWSGSSRGRTSTC